MLMHDYFYNNNGEYFIIYDIDTSNNFTLEKVVKKKIALHSPFFLNKSHLQHVELG